MKVFVTGADGFIGSHLCEALRDRGDEVTGLALYNSFDSFGWLDEVEGVKKVRGDVRDSAQMNTWIKGHEIVFHLAALISVPYSYEAHRSFIDTNVTGTLNVLLAATSAGAKFVHTSSSEVYGSMRGEWSDGMDESHPIQPQSPYAASKVAADALVRAFNLSYGLPAIILRPFNTYGPRQSQRAVVPTIVRQVLDPEAGAINLGNVNTRRDLTYVTDTVRAFLAVADLPNFGVYNAGTGETHFISSLAQRIIRHMDSVKPINTVRDRHRPKASEVDCLLADASALSKATGWSPQVSLDHGLIHVIAWHRVRPVRDARRYLT